MGKTDSTGPYAYVCDGTAPGSPVLSDAHAVYNPGLSEDRAGVVTYSDNDALGNLWTLDAGAGDSTPGGCLYTAFGSPILTSNLATPFRYGGASGCQTDADTGLVLMGHRYYDSRTGRFLTQDHAKSGGNWYAYCGNNPVNASDPSGNVPQTVNGGTASINSAGYLGAMSEAMMEALDASLAFGMDDKAQIALQDTIALSKKKAAANDGQSVNLFMGMVFDFFSGKGASVRNYGPDSTQVLTFLESMGAQDLFQQLADQGFSKNAAGGVGHIMAFIYSAGDPFNGSQGHMGAFDWSVVSQSGNNLNVVVHNDMSRASFTGGNTFGFGVSNPTSGPQRTITEYLRFTVPIPR